MKLTTAIVTLFRNILDSTPVAIQSDVTCLVGKNESGKTAFLHALYRLNPARPNVSFSIPEQYPAWREKLDRHSGIDLEAITPVSCHFTLEERDLEMLAAKFGQNVVQTSDISVERPYSGQWSIAAPVDEPQAVVNFIASIDIPSPHNAFLSHLKSFDAVRAAAAQIVASAPEDPAAKDASDKITKSLALLLGQATLSEAVAKALEPLVPKFFYYDVYSTLPARVNIRKLLESDPSKLNDDDLTALSLLRLAATDDDYLLNPDYERRKRELENVANALTSDVLKYWSQNPELRVQIDISQENIRNPQGQVEAVLDELKFRMWDERHWLSLPFDLHSTGFRWFFSFLAAFSQYEFTETPVIILLDEPALGLHARAQKDFLRFIDERLSPRHQVIHTTHSPFMVQPGKLERVRLVEDRGREFGAVVSTQILSKDPDTLFPLQGALGYDLVQHLFISPNNLVVEGTSDYTYLSVISDFLEANSRVHLDPRWSIVPVGGADLIPTFVALLGVHLDLTVLVDSRKAGLQRLSQLAQEGYLSGKRIIAVGEVIGRKFADIEDVFTQGDYLSLYNQAFSKSIAQSDLSGTDPIVSKIARHEGIESFDHGRPADILLRHRDVILPKLTAESLSRFEKLFQKLNDTLPSAA